MDKTPINTTEFADESTSTSTGITEDTALDIQKFKEGIEDQAPDENAPPPLTWKEGKALKKAKYTKIKDNFDTAYILQNKKTLQVAEIQASSSYHACTMIGWKPNQTKVIDIVNVKEREETLIDVVEENEETVTTQ